MLLDLGPSLPPPTAALAEIPPGKEGVRQTLKLMAALARRGKKHVRVLMAARQIVQHFPQKDYQSEVEALHQFVRDHIRYVKDIAGVETIQTPERTLEMRSGDCDDKATLLAAMLETLGHRARFHAVGFRPDHYSHVYAETLLGRAWLPLETTEDWEAGRAPARAVTHMIVHV